MGEVRIPIKSLLGGQVVDKWFTVTACKGCSNPKGELHLNISCSARRALSIKQRESMPISDRVIAVGLGWDLIGGKTAIDLDTSCVAVSSTGAIMMEECAYFAQLCSRSGAIRHTGDEREGDEDLGQGDDEIIVVDLNRLPSSVAALFFIATVATEGKSFKDVKSARMRLLEYTTGEERCRYHPAVFGDHTALFMCRVARIGNTGLAGADFCLQSIGETDRTARDWGTLVPEIKMYMADLIPNIKYVYTHDATNTPARIPPHHTPKHTPHTSTHLLALISLSLTPTQVRRQRAARRDAQGRQRAPARLHLGRLPSAEAHRRPRVGRHPWC